MKVFIIGASGLVGSNTLTCLNRDPFFDAAGSHFSFETDHTVYFNVFEPEKSTFDLRSFRPDVIVHTGALTHVDYCETHPEESRRNTVDSTRAAVVLAKKYGAKFVFISSDYVFDGFNGPYGEADALHPLSVYGQHKKEAEEIVLDRLPDALIYRITNVYGHEIRGKNFIAFLIRMALSSEAKTLYLPSDQYATPVNAYDIGRITARMLKDGKSGVYHLASDDYLSRVDLAELVLSYFPHHGISVKGKPTSELKQAAPRPLKGGLKTDKVLKEYPDFVFSRVRDYMKELGYDQASE